MNNGSLPPKYIMLLIMVPIPRVATQLLKARDGNEAGFFGYPSRSAPNGTGFKFNKRVWDGYEIFFLNPGQVQVLPHPPLPPAVPIIYKINFKINLI